MSTALAIAGVTAILRDRLNDGLVNNNAAGVLGSTVTVSVLPPDRVVSGEAQETSQLNLYLYRVSAHGPTRNDALPSHDRRGQRLSNPPLALRLHYLLSAYSGGDLHGEILLGYAMQLMHQFPVITREMIRTALDPAPDVGIDLPPALRALADSGLAEQVEQLRITPHYLDTEELSKLWTATQASCRPSAAYEVSLVLIEATEPVRASLPVLSRGERDPVSGRDRGVIVSPTLVPPLPALRRVRPAGEQSAARIGETVTLEGHHLNGANRTVTLRSERFALSRTLPASGPAATSALAFELAPAEATEIPVGVYEVFASLVLPDEAHARETNRLALLVAPNITNLPQTIARDGDGTLELDLDFTPHARPGQRVSLILGQREVEAAAFGTPTGSLHFTVPQAAPGTHLARLRIDGVDSPIIDHDSTPPAFLDLWVTVT